jgi:hypothetical protein
VERGAWQRAAPAPLGVQRGTLLGVWRLAQATALAVLLSGLACAPSGAPWLDDEDVASLVERTSQVRGLVPRRPVRVRALPPEQVRSYLAHELDRMVEPHALAADEALKHVLGLLPAETDLREAILALQAGTVVGLYTPLERTLHLVSDSAPAGPLGAQTQTVIVHEIVHALQDQHTGLLDVTLGLVDHDDLSFALGALLEGDATWTAFQEEARRTGLPPPTAEAYAREMEAFGSEAVRLGAPRLLRDAFLLAYPEGYALVARLVEGGGVAALDAALFDPPLSSQEVLHPERYLGARRPLAMPALEPGRFAPEAACRLEASNTFGELGLRLWAVEAGAVPEDAAAAAAGWRADRAMLLACPQGFAFAWMLHFESPAAAAGFLVRARVLAWAGATEGLAGVPRLDAHRARVLLSAGLSEEGRRWLLREAPLVSFRDLTEYLTARPSVLERARRLRGPEQP